MNQSAETEAWARLTDDERESLMFAFGINFHTEADHERFLRGVRMVEQIMAERRVVRFACQTHACGSCAGCKAAKVRDLLTEATEHEGRVRGLVLWLRKRLADTSGWTTEDYDAACDHVLRRLVRIYSPGQVLS